MDKSEIEQGSTVLNGDKEVLTHMIIIGSISAVFCIVGTVLFVMMKIRERGRTNP